MIKCFEQATDQPELCFRILSLGQMNQKIGHHQFFFK